MDGLEELLQLPSASFFLSMVSLRHGDGLNRTSPDCICSAFVCKSHLAMAQLCSSVLSFYERKIYIARINERIHTDFCQAQKTQINAFEKVSKGEIVLHSNAVAIIVFLSSPEFIK